MELSAVISDPVVTPPGAISAHLSTGGGAGSRMKMMAALLAGMKTNRGHCGRKPEKSVCVWDGGGGGGSAGFDEAFHLDP